MAEGGTVRSHYLVTERDGDGWFWYIDHPDDCLQTDGDRLRWKTCGMDDFLESLDEEAFPEPPFRVPVVVEVERLPGGPWGPPEVDAWLAPLGDGEDG